MISRRTCYDTESRMMDLQTYDWERHCWTETSGGYNPELIPTWRSYAARLSHGFNGIEMTTYGGWPRVGWRPVVAFEMRSMYPGSDPEPAVLLIDRVLGGASWHSLVSIADMRAVSQEVE